MNIPSTLIASSLPPSAEPTSGANDLLPLRSRSTELSPPAPGIVQPDGQPVVSADRKPAVLPPRPQNSGTSSPFNPATDMFETTTFRVGDVGVTARYNNGGLLTQPRDRGTQPIAPAGASVNPVRVDVNIPVVKDAIFTLDVKARVDSAQNYRVGPEAGLNLGNLRLTVGIFENQPIQSLLENDGRARTELSGAASLKVSDTLGVGVGVSRSTGGTASQSGTTRIEPNVSVNMDGTQVQAAASFTFDDRRGNTQVGGSLTIQPAQPDNTRPYGFAVVKIGDNPLTDDSASFSINGGLRF